MRFTDNDRVLLAAVAADEVYTDFRFEGTGITARNGEYVIDDLHSHSWSYARRRAERLARLKRAGYVTRGRLVSLRTGRPWYVTAAGVDQLATTAPEGTPEEFPAVDDTPDYDDPDAPSIDNDQVPEFVDAPDDAILFLDLYGGWYERHSEVWVRVAPPPPHGQQEGTP